MAFEPSLGINLLHKHASSGSSDDKLKLDTSNDPLTGNLEISKADPELRLTDTGDSEYSRITRSDTAKKVTRYNRVNKSTAGGTAKAIDFELDLNQYVTYPYNADTDFTSGDFAVECWFKPESQGRAGRFCGTYYGDDNNGWTLDIDAAANIWFGWYNGGWVRVYIFNSENPLSNGTWYHIAGVHDATGQTLKLYLDGTLIHSAATGGVLPITQADTGITIGMTWPSYEIDGVIQSVRVSNNQRYTGNFTPSTTIFESDANTMFLANFDSSIDDISHNALTGTFHTDSGTVSYVDGTLTKSPVNETVEALVWSSENGVDDTAEEGQQKFGDDDGRTVLQGANIYIGTGTTKKVGFYNTAPVDQPATVDDAATQDLTGLNTIDQTKTEADLTSCKNAINAIIDRLQELGLIA